MTTILDILKNYRCETASFICTKNIGVCYNLIGVHDGFFENVILMFEKTNSGNLLCRKLKCVNRDSVFLGKLSEIIIDEKDFTFGKDVRGNYCRIIKGLYVDLYCEKYEEDYRLFVE